MWKGNKKKNQTGSRLLLDSHDCVRNCAEIGMRERMCVRACVCMRAFFEQPVVNLIHKSNLKVWKNTWVRSWFSRLKERTISFSCRALVVRRFSRDVRSRRSSGQF